MNVTGYGLEDGAQIEVGDIAHVSVTDDTIRLTGSLPVNVTIEAKHPFIVNLEVLR